MTIRSAFLLATAALLVPHPVLAHAGHVVSAEWHWHASDTLGLLVVASSAAVAWWLSGGGRR